MSQKNALLLCICFLLCSLQISGALAQTGASQSDSTCKPSLILGGIDSFPEVQGVSDTQTLWALLFTPPKPFIVNDEVKIVWRMTGSGRMNIVATHTDGMEITPVWGPELHSGSNWNRPGAEWGTGLRFPKAGCWRINVTQGADAGYIDVQVVDADYITPIRLLIEIIRAVLDQSR